MIAVKNVSKTFNTLNGKVEVLKDINFEIDQGDIFGIIGFSGAGKSTLIRCLNGLEKPDFGNIIIGEKLNSDDVKSFLQEKYGVAVVPAF